jgi:heme-degrading monooxygenase HmoA
MFLHMTVVKMVPEEVSQAYQVFTTPESIQGLRQALLVESLEEPGRLTWLTLWESLVEARAFLSSLGYAERVSKLKPYLLSPPQWFGYNVLEKEPLTTESMENTGERFLNS